MAGLSLDLGDVVLVQEKNLVLFDFGRYMRVN